jgi:hypothetical protein
MGTETVEKRMSHDQGIGLRKGVNLVAKEGQAKRMQLFFGDPNPTLVVKKIYESNGMLFCKTIDCSVKSPKGQGGRIHVLSFLEKYFQLSSPPHLSKK